MDSPIYIAAGGGGDAIAAWAIHNALRPGTRPVIATFAWDRLLVDPRPGPRTVTDFDELTTVDEHNSAITARTRPSAPSRSTLPRLASEIDATLILLDPHRGAVGMRTQLRALVQTMGADGIEVVDVGGDILARGSEPTLLSPIADALSLAATTGQDVPVEILVAGVSLDGELPHDLLNDYIQSVGGCRRMCLSATDSTPILPILEWHPSEATALLAAAAIGLRGRVEIRDGGHVVELRDDSPYVFAASADILMANSATASAILDSESLDDAEQSIREVCGRSELDSERHKADRLNRIRPSSHFAADTIIAHVEDYCVSHLRDGIEFITFRRLAEIARLSLVNATRLRHELIARQPDRYVAPLWSVHPHRG